MKKIVWTFGLISGAILSLMMLVTIPFSEKIGYDKGLVIGYTTMVLSFLLVYFGIRSYRDNVGRGVVSFGRALAVGLGIVLISSLCYVATWEVLYFKFTPDHLQKYNEYIIQKERQSGASEAAIAQTIAEQRQFTERYDHVLFNSAITFLEPLPVGVVIALISAGVLRRKRREEGAGGLVASVV
jgi:hypothetical protein